MSIPEIVRAAAEPSFRRYLTDLLVEVCNVDTTPHADVSVSRQNEARVFDILEREFRGYGLPNASAERRPIDPAIAQHPFFSNLYYTRTPQRPEGLPVEEAYAGRANLVLKVDGEAGDARAASDGGGVNQAIDVHVDVIAPYFPPRVEGDRVFGRGACDDKGNAVALMGALRLVGHYLQQSGMPLHKHFTGLMVIEEETGGNGSLSIALDRELKRRYDSLVVLEICESRLHPGNRGAVWYKVEGRIPGVNLFEASAFVVEEMEKEGRAIRAESDHPLFPHRPVQTCHGIIGRNGQHPSRINGLVSFDIVFAEGADAAKARKVVTDVLEDGLKQYVGLYGDKTQVIDPKTGKPKVDHHYDLAEAEHGYTVTVHGSTGHMGSIFENDGAITKMATMVRALIRSRVAIARQALGIEVRPGKKAKRVKPGAVTFRLADWEDQSHLLMEGGQGFLPTHPMEEVQQRMREAVWRGADNYLRLIGKRAPAKKHIETMYNKLHNAAFAGAADSPDMLNAIAAAKEAGIWRDEPIRGWDVSCDARIFACEYPDMAVITTGPGSLNFAHSDFEQIDIPEMVKFAEFLAYYILRQTGTAE